MNTIRFGGLFLVIFGLLFALQVRSADTASVTATVTVENISVSVADGTIAYGTLGQNSTTSTVPGIGNDTQVATNDGNVASNLNIKGQDSASWTLAAAAGADEYVHRFCNDTDLDCSAPVANYTALTTNYQTLDTGIAAAGTVNFQLHINTPNPSSVYVQQSVNVTVQAVEA